MAVFRTMIVAAFSLIASAPAFAQTTTPLGGLKPLEFLIGQWEGGGTVADAGGTAHGISSITVQADGHLLLRQDRTTVLDKAGRPTQGFGQTMIIYAEGGGVRADYVDGEGHVIHYGSANVMAGASVEFTSLAPAGAPVFRLRYDAVGRDALKVAFSLRPPGQVAFQPIAVGVIHRAPA